MGLVQQQLIASIVTYVVGPCLCFLMVVFPLLNVYSVECPIIIFSIYLWHALCATLFADNTAVYFASTNITESRNALQSDLQLLFQCINKNRPVLNVAKTKGTLFSVRCY